MSMLGKTVIVTGANSGIGLVTTRELARQGATVVMACRSQERGSRALAEIKRAVPEADVHLMLCDLSAPPSVRQFADSFKQQYDRLDVLVNNAGLYNVTRQVTADGLESTFAINHLGHFLLTNLLLDRLQASTPSRIINVSSGAHAMGRLDLDDLQNARGRYRGFQVYGESKLCNVLFTYELARRLQGTGVTANCLHPGFVNTNFGRNNGFLSHIIGSAVSLFALNVEEGAQTSIYLATSPEVEGVSGKYFVKSRPQSSSRASYDEALQRGLWEKSAALAGLSA